MIYKVTKQYGKGPETIDKGFTTQQEAEEHAKAAAETDASMKIQVVYRVYEFDDVLKEINTDYLIAAIKEGEHTAGGSGSGKGQSISFKPTPFNTTPRPKGGPQGWVKDEDDDANNDKD